MQPNSINYSRHLSGNADTLKRYPTSRPSYDSTSVYGPHANFISKTKSGLSREILPSKSSWQSSEKYKRNETTTSPISHHSIYSPSDNYRKYHLPSAPKTHHDKSQDIIRPSMRDRSQSSRRLNSGNMGSSSFGSTSVTSNDISSHASSTQYNRRFNGVHDVKSTYNSSVPHNVTRFTAAGRSTEAISVEQAPYSEPYRPSFASKRPPNPKVQLTSGTSSSYSSLKYEGTGTIGLKNIGNTCFMNSILQCLSHTLELRDFCLRQKYLDDINSKSPMKGKLMRAFAEVIQQLWESSSSASLSITPSNFKSQIQKFSPRFVGYEQQDSQEFLRFLLEGLHEDINKIEKKSSEPMPDLPHASPQEIARATWKWYEKKDRSFVFDLFVGQLESSLKCLECGHVSLTYDPFWDLSLPISKSTYGLDTSIDDCFGNFTKEELLERDEKPTCEKCKVRRNMKKKLLIHRFPKILVLHLKRFHEGSRYRQKLTNLVNFPLNNLKLSTYASATCEDPKSSVYDLYAVSNHCGSCYGGHYTAFCNYSNQWHEFSDSRVSSVNESSICTKEAYVLFYIQKTARSSRL